MRILIFIAVLTWAVFAYGVVAIPNPVVFYQPDGTSFQGYLWGDEFLNGGETLEGWTILKHQGWWEFAILNDQGKLIPSGKRVLQSEPPAQKKHLRPLVLPAHPTQRSLRVDPMIGSQPVLVLLVAFQDQGPIGSTPEYWAESFFGEGKSNRQFYLENSYGLLDMPPVEETYGTPNDGVVGWITLDQNHPNTGGNLGDANAIIVKKALEAADDYVDFSKLDRDGNGRIDWTELHIVVVVAGYEAATGNCSPSVWGHRSGLDSPDPPSPTSAPVLDGVVVGSYFQDPKGGYSQFGEWQVEGSCDKGHPATIGVMSHELGHDLGLDDMYSYYWTGIGYWGVMGSGSWAGIDLPGDSPSHFCPYNKWYLGWIDPEVVETEGRYTLRAVENHPDALRILGEGGFADKEFFLVENRLKKGFDESLPGEGVLIWHVRGHNCLSGNVFTTADEFCIVPEEADGDQGLLYGGSAGSAGDPFPGYGGPFNPNFMFGTTTTPSSYLIEYDEPSNVVISGFGSPGEEVALDINLQGDESQGITITIPAISHADGANQSVWRSDACFLNMDEVAQEVTLNSGDQTLSLSLDAGEQVCYDDLLLNTFQQEGAQSLAIQTPTLKVMGLSRTYNLKTDGTYGIGLPAFDPAYFTRKGGPTLYLFPLTETPTYHTNLGMVTLGGGVQAEVKVYTSEGIFLASQTYDLEADSFHQIAYFLAQLGYSLEDAYITVTVKDGEGTLFAYLSVIDNRTGDAYVVPAMQAGHGGRMVVIPAVTNAFGSHNSHWVSDVAILNTHPTLSREVLLRFHGQEGYQSATLTLEPKALVNLKNFLEDQFGVEDSGMLIVQQNTYRGDDLLVVSRTYDDQPDGTYGQLMPAVPYSQSAKKGQRLILPMLVADPNFRVNIGVAEVGGSGGTGAVKIYNRFGAEVKSQSLTFTGYGFTNLLDVLEGLDPNQGPYYAMVIGYSPNLRLTAYASIIDNRTQDTFTSVGRIVWGE